jgi:hypothetical protein
MISPTAIASGRLTLLANNQAAAYTSCRDLCGAAGCPAGGSVSRGGGLVQAVMVSVWCPAVVGIVTSVPRLVWRI